MIRQRHARANVRGHDDDDGEEHPPGKLSYQVSGLQWLLRKRRIFPLLLAIRALSAFTNIIHDCDEVFNYWEPLHYLLYGYGLQTWEYSAKFALRPYLYLLLHSMIATPVGAIVGASGSKVLVFYGVRLGLGAISAACDTFLVRSTLKQVGPEAASILLVLLLGTTGPFLASTTFLPSTFSMYTVTVAAAAVLRGNWQGAIVPAAVGCVWGWSVAAVAFVPFALAVLLLTPFLQSVVILLAALLVTVVPLVVVDRLFYGTWTVSVWNFIEYNVIGGGESALYGVESWTFYLRNGINNLNVVFVLALMLPVLLSLQWMTGGLISIGSKSRSSGPLLTTVSSAFLWTAAISVLPHKEERFLYVVYPLICLCASLVLATVPKAVMILLSPLMVPRKTGARLGMFLTWAVLGLSLGLSASRTTAQLRFYGAPMQVYQALPQGLQGNGTSVNVCVGNEWHRFPSSFFLPSPDYRLHFVKSGFGGLLPKAFDPAAGGTAAAPPELNNRNQEEMGLYISNPALECDFFIGLAEHREGPSEWWEGEDISWYNVTSVPFVDASLSPLLPRALYIPGLSQMRNKWLEYVLLARESPRNPVP